ncbi:hypothetical protein KIH39_25180 [Telmatocola sphagniphila]|uniref:Uncharacterized protein n=1 Tax=Telmatocola sphagniphila TaxID=1123043 RepID=A0A8E6ET78_9BACT|nr:hypothetical protein [Telmatocola sphagniphila]QVL32089.1 hypothetical protein KIH39_25180 [Telmatocola sphagniphila]
MRRLIFLVLLVLAAAGGYHLYKDKDARKLLQSVVDKATKNPLAKTPKEAADYFLKAIKDRDYERAADYCTSAYAEQLRAGAADAKKLGDAIDGLMDKMSLVKITNIGECKYVLWCMDPFPREGLAIVVSEVNDPKVKTAAGTFVLSPKILGVDRIPDQMPQNYHPSRDFIGGLYKGLPERINFVKEGEGDKVSWKLDMPCPPEVVSAVQSMKKNEGSLAREIRDLSQSINKDAAIKEDFTRFFVELVNKWAM